VFNNVPPGDYVVQAIGSPPVVDGRMAGSPEFVAQFVTVTDTDPPPLSLTTSRGATLRGRIRFEGAPPTRVTLNAAPADFDRAPMVGFGTVGFTMEPDGTFEYQRLTGPRRLVLGSAVPSMFLKSATIRGQDAADVPFDFGFVEAVFDDVEVVVSAAGATINGSATDERGGPASEYSVIVFPTQRDKWYTASRFLKLGRPMQDGTFRVEGLPPGDYWFAAVDRVEAAGASGEWQDPAVLESLVPRANRVTLGEGESHAAVLRVIRR
jgi:hypothetical protein